jgi:hypothetical protein
VVTFLQRVEDKTFLDELRRQHPPRSIRGSRRRNSRAAQAVKPGGTGLARERLFYRLASTHQVQWAPKPLRNSLVASFERSTCSAGP